MVYLKDLWLTIAIAIAANIISLAVSVYSKNYSSALMSTCILLFVFLLGYIDKFSNILCTIRLQQDDSHKILNHIDDVLNHSKAILLLNNFKTYGNIEPYSKWKHYKGGEYTVLTLGFSTVDQSELVIYKDSLDRVWARPYSEWEEEVVLGSIKVKRFIRI